MPRSLYFLLYYPGGSDEKGGENLLECKVYIDHAGGSHAGWTLIGGFVALA